MVTWIIIVLALVLSAFFSGMEIAFVTSNKLKLEIAIKKDSFNSKVLALITKNSSQYISTMLVGNNLANVIYTIFLAKLLAAPLAPLNNELLILLLQTIIATVIVLFFAEFLPKTLFRILSDSALSTFAVPVAFFYLLFYPIVVISVLFARLIARIFGIRIDDHQKDNMFSRVDIEDIIGNGTELSNSAKSSQELKIFHNAMDFSSIKLRECIVPRNKILAVPVNESVENVRKMFVETGHSNLLVYKENVDDIIGYVNIKDIFKNPQKLRNIMRQILVVPETMSAKKLFGRLIKNNRSIAVVVDEFGSTCGIVTVEDILEEIFGEFEDEHDSPELSVVVNKDGNYIMSGLLDVETFNEEYGYSLTESDEYETIAGYIMYFSGNFPKMGEIVTVNDNDVSYRFRILEIKGTKIVKVMLYAE
ncbi:MAG: HlyC/CorC family transporter [Bacteroidales bacterium]|nr:HlyC/CorC family transporter [Bacteroidales bacterium]MBR6068373.1 HlyC/CorC family transporter [Bacteroidales bacterium]